MKHIGIYAGALAILAVPAVLFAQTYGTMGTWQDLVASDDNSRLLELISLWSTLTVAFITSLMVWMGGRKMHGGVFGKVLTYFSLGMTLVFLGFATEVPWLQKIDHLYLKVTHDSLYIIGYVLMGLAANKLLKAIKGE
jgi:glucan phosphoethanolaminetransferase (alkaline phosphatase superfamily)